ncbi:PREDICTED: deoxyribodipyrimidine photo-lyase-like [Acropora digitifera]|uniref:deoxyribodipyrimidine photo-lyase-like n=1 Tax=Acropora digitifera TaxID=70779 RepID=UPI00077A5AA0|nr:PREDICTED: deoxyribodipyrimidine photo-lyase-like [Acropora digitifera]
MASQPPAKRRKEESSENGDDILASCMAKRAQVCASVADFKFNKKRVRLLSKSTDISDDCKAIAYWMWRDQRVQDNWALLYAQRMALKQEVPLVVCFCLPSKYLHSTFRQYSFMIKGLQQVEKELASLNINFHMLLGEPNVVLPDFVKSENIGGIIADFTPLRKPIKWLNDVMDKLPKNVPVCQVDSHNIIPCWQASPKLEYGARTIRPKIHNQMREFLTEFPPVIKHPHAGKASIKTAWKTVDEFIEVDRNVQEVNWAEPGTKAGLEMLESFCKDRLKFFATDRNNPTKEALSDLSPWFHAGNNQLIMILQLVNEGKMHGFLRMYWAKKILEWTESAEEGLEISLYLNDKYSLDGTDPNGYVGCMWSVCGIHDQGWAERPVFGKIRYMNYNGCKRKFDVGEFVRKYGATTSKEADGPAKKRKKAK